MLQVNLLYLVTSSGCDIGAVQRGPDLYYAKLHTGKASLLLTDYFDTIKKNWKQALPMGIVNTLLTLLIVFDIYFFYLTKRRQLPLL